MFNFLFIVFNKQNPAMTTLGLELDDDVTAVSNQEDIFRDDDRAAASSRALQVVGSTSILTQLFEVAVQETASPSSRTQGEDAFDAIT